MEYRIFKSLDKPNSLFSLKGSYIKITGYLILGSLFLAFLIGSLIGSLVGFILFFSLSAASYGGVLAFQAKYSERRRDRILHTRNFPDYIAVPPVRMSKYVKIINGTKKGLSDLKTELYEDDRKDGPGRSDISASGL